MVLLEVRGLNGPVCSIRCNGDSTGRELKEAIEKATLGRFWAVLFSTRLISKSICILLKKHEERCIYIYVYIYIYISLSLSLSHQEVKECTKNM